MFTDFLFSAVKYTLSDPVAVSLNKRSYYYDCQNSGFCRWLFNAFSRRQRYSITFSYFRAQLCL